MASDQHDEWAHMLEERIGILMESGMDEARATLQAREMMRRLYILQLMAEGKDPQPWIEKWKS